jgi:O-antigen/teichoic acid export membrane protein
MLVSTFFTIISVPYDAVINAHENMFLVAVLGIIEAILKLTIAIYITHTSFDKLITYGVLMASLSILLLIMRRIYCHKKYEEVVINIRAYFSNSLFREMTGFAGWSFLGSASSMISNYGQGIVVNMFFGTIVNAAQGVASQVSGQLGAFAGTMLKALNPIIDKSEGAGNRDKMLKTSMTGSKIAFFLLIFFYIPIFIEMPFIFNIWLKSVPDYAILFCRLLLIRNLIEQLYVTMVNSIAAVGNISRFQIYNSILNFFPLVIAYILFKYNYPPYSLYLIFIVYSICNGFLILYFTNRICNLPISVYLKNVVFPCLITLTLILGLSIVPLIILPIGIVRFIFILTISSSAFLVFVWFIGLSKEERAIIEMIINPLVEKIRFKKK